MITILLSLFDSLTDKRIHSDVQVLHRPAELEVSTILVCRIRYFGGERVANCWLNCVSD